MNGPGSPKDEYAKGYVDGLRQAEYEKHASLLDNLMDGLFFGEPYRDSSGSYAYQEGFKEGKQDGSKKSN